MSQIIIALFGIFGPIITGIIQGYMESHNGAMPTDAEILAEFQKNIDSYLAEGEAWKAEHPEVPPVVE